MQTTTLYISAMLIGFVYYLFQLFAKYGGLHWPL
jgi:hypothetical protein